MMTGAFLLVNYSALASLYYNAILLLNYADAILLLNYNSWFYELRGVILKYEVDTL